MLNRLKLYPHHALIGGAIFLLFSMVPFYTYSTSIGGGTRNVQIQGVVDAGMTNGANNGDWENNEELSGAGGVNWYMTWDDFNLFVGKIGGINTEYCVIYIRAEYSGAAFNLTGFGYDNLNPDVSPMGGVNFACRFNTTSDEFSTWNGASWSTPVSGLLPQFSTQGNGDNMEIAIPWNTITASNGKPDNIRVLLYQYDPTSPNCNPPPTLPYVFAESPWGDGAANGGPTLGVTDGVPTSASPQPSGCASGASQITRWWGCYPATGGVGPGTHSLQQADAGSDFGICDTVAFTMNAPTPLGIGTWEILAKPAGAPDPVFVDSNDPTTVISNILNYGEYWFTWTVDYGGCYNDKDTIVVTNFRPPDPAVTGTDMSLACEEDSAFITANDPGPPINGTGGTGVWTIISGSGTFANDSTNNTSITGLAPGENVLLWSVTNGACPGNDDTMRVTTFGMPTAIAGQDTGACEVGSIQLNANDPSMQGSTTGRWWQIAGPTGVVFSNAFDHQATVDSLSIGNYRLIWVMDNGVCPGDTDTVAVSIYAQPTSDAGIDAAFCNITNFNLLGSIPQLISNEAVGTWTQVAGPSALISVANHYNPSITGITEATYQFSWTVVNGACPPAIDTVEIDIKNFVHPGFSEIIHPETGESNGSVTVATPTTGTPPYWYSVDGGATGTTQTFTGLAAGPHSFTIFDANSCMIFESVVLGIEDVIPGGFSPNGDTQNDTWIIPVLNNIDNVTVKVFNVWGNEVYRSEGMYTPWDGTFNGNAMPVGTYYYIIDAILPGSTDASTLKGSVTILR